MNVLPQETIDDLYPRYAEAWHVLLLEASARHVLMAEEFREEMQDGRFEKVVVIDDLDRVVAMTTLTADLAAVPWINPTFYQHRFPDHTSRGALFFATKLRHSTSIILDRPQPRAWSQSRPAGWPRPRRRSRRLEARTVRRICTQLQSAPSRAPESRLLTDGGGAPTSNNGVPGVLVSLAPCWEMSRIAYCSRSIDLSTVHTPYSPSRIPSVCFSSWSSRWISHACRNPAPADRLPGRPAGSAGPAHPWRSPPHQNEWTDRAGPAPRSRAPPAQPIRGRTRRSAAAIMASSDSGCRRR